ncbi:hypothetical protein LRS74_23075 [Streptomyces sp. LX-29]|uniref:hypothetical protein n=1 Tax=Streptomyces sp. LX-29 TaxID=2900152 RepID=UPI00240E0B37|nr:hypothetical protein [Streptomyces sp. LX-29]WFB09605.1 hypothetical protein LRS74_23075 [Streptomyces sp. LX-29]
MTVAEFGQMPPEPLGWEALRAQVIQLAKDVADADLDGMSMAERERIARVAMATAHLAQRLMARTAQPGGEWWTTLR